MPFESADEKKTRSSDSPQSADELGILMFPFYQMLNSFNMPLLSAMKKC